MGDAPPRDRREDGFPQAPGAGKGKGVVVNSGLLDSLWEEPKPAASPPAEPEPEVVRTPAPPPKPPDPRPRTAPRLSVARPTPPKPGPEVPVARSPAARPASPPVTAARPPVEKTPNAGSGEALHESAGRGFRNGRYEEAAAALQQLTRRDPGSWPAHFNLALCWARLERWDEAADSFTAVCRIQPRYWQAYTGLGICLLRQGLSEPALSSFEKALQFSGGEFQPRFGRALALQMMERYMEAHGLYEELVAEQPESVDVLANLTIVAAAVGRTAQASACAARVHELRHGTGAFASGPKG